MDAAGEKQEVLKSKKEREMSNKGRGRRWRDFMVADCRIINVLNPLDVPPNVYPQISQMTQIWSKNGEICGFLFTVFPV
jgi:hypothetical protein